MMCEGVTIPQYSQRLTRPQPRRLARCSGRRDQPTAAGFSRPSGRHRSTASVISVLPRSARPDRWFLGGVLTAGTAFQSGP
jgi:hypothetical protein